MINQPLLQIRMGRLYLLYFQMELVGTQPQALIQYNALLISTKTRNLVASRRFTARHTLSEMEVSETISAPGIAANQVARELIEWALEQGQSGS